MADEETKTPPRKDVRVSLSLTPRLYDELLEAATDKALAPSVLIKTWAVEKLRQWQRERKG